MQGIIELLQTIDGEVLAKMDGDLKKCMLHLREQDQTTGCAMVINISMSPPKEDSTTIDVTVNSKPNFPKRGGTQTLFLEQDRLSKKNPFEPEIPGLGADDGE